MADSVTIQIIGLDKLKAKFSELSSEIRETNGAAGKEAAEVILNTTGVRSYPPETAANHPPTPYYVRGYGMQYAGGNNGASERYGTQFTVESDTFTTTIGNRASYGVYLGGNPNAKAMARIGWRSLVEVANEKIPEITRIYQGWINRLIKRVGL